MSVADKNVDLLRFKLHKIVNETKNCNVYEDLTLFKDKLESENIEGKDLYSLLMIVECTNVRNYLYRDSVSMIDVNNIVTNISSRCGLEKSQAQYYLSVIFYSVGFTIDMESAYHVVKKEKSSIKELDISGADCERTIKVIEEDINQKSDAFTANNHVMANFEKLIKANNDVALYLRGRCYYEGIGVQQDVAQARDLLVKSADLGNVKAAAFLGDAYYDGQMFTNAYEYYTRIGAVPLSKKRQENLKTILKFKEVNKKVMVTVVLTYLLSIVFAIITMVGGLCAGKCTHLPSGIILSIVLTAYFVLFILYSRKYEYDSIKYSLLTMLFMDLIFSFTAYVI